MVGLVQHPGVLVDDGGDDDGIVVVLAGVDGVFKDDVTGRDRRIIFQLDQFNRFVIQISLCITNHKIVTNSLDVYENLIGRFVVGDARLCTLALGQSEGVVTGLADSDRAGEGFFVDVASDNVLDGCGEGRIEDILVRRSLRFGGSQRIGNGLAVIRTYYVNNERGFIDGLAAGSGEFLLDELGEIEVERVGVFLLEVGVGEGDLLIIGEHRSCGRQALCRRSFRFNAYIVGTIILNTDCQNIRTAVISDSSIRTRFFRYTILIRTRCQREILVVSEIEILIIFSAIHCNSTNVSMFLIRIALYRGSEGKVFIGNLCTIVCFRKVLLDQGVEVEGFLRLDVVVGDGEPSGVCVGGAVDGDAFEAQRMSSIIRRNIDGQLVATGGLVDIIGHTGAHGSFFDDGIDIGAGGCEGQLEIAACSHERLRIGVTSVIKSGRNSCSGSCGSYFCTSLLHVDCESLVAQLNVGVQGLLDLAGEVKVDRVIGMPLRSVSCVPSDFFGEFVLFDLIAAFVVPTKEVVTVVRFCCRDSRERIIALCVHFNVLRIAVNCSAWISFECNLKLRNGGNRQRTRSCSNRVVAGAEALFPRVGNIVRYALSRGHVSSTFDRTVCLEIVDFLHEARCTFASRFDRSIRQGVAIVFLRARTRSQRNCKRGDFKPAVVDGCNLNVAVLAGADGEEFRVEPHHVRASVGTNCLGRLVLFQRNNYIRLRCATAGNRIVEVGHALFTAAVRCGQGVAGDGDGDFGIVLRNFQLAKLLCDFVVGCLGLADQSIFEFIITLARLGLRTGKGVGCFISANETDTFAGGGSDFMLGQRGTVIFLLVASGSQGDGALGDGVGGCCIFECLSGTVISRVLECDVQVVSVAGNSSIIFDLHIFVGRKTSLVPATRLIALLNGIGICIAATCNGHNDIHIRVLLAVSKRIDVLRNGGQHIKASTVIHFASGHTSDARLGNLDRDGGVVDINKRLVTCILDARAFIGWLRAAIVIVRNVKTDNQFLPTISIILFTAPFIREIKTLYANSIALPLGLYCFRCSLRRSKCQCPIVFAGAICNLKANIFRIC